MLIDKGNKPGYLWDTKKRIYVKDPSAKMKTLQTIEVSNSTGEGLDFEELLGVHNTKRVELKPNIKYLITEEEWKLATPESCSIVSDAYEYITMNLKSGVLMETSILFSIGHKARVVELVSALLLNAHVGGLSIHRIQYLSMIDASKIDRLNKELLVLIAPHTPTDLEISTLSTLMEYREQLGLPTIIVTSKYSVSPYRVVLNTEKNERLDLALLVALQQERNINTLETFSEGVDFNLTKVKNKHRATVSKPDDPKLEKEYQREVSSAFVDISREKSIDATKTLFNIEEK